MNWMTRLCQLTNKHVIKENFIKTMSWLHQQRNVTTQFDGVNMNFKVNAQVLLIWGFKAETCEGILVLFKTCQSVAGPLKGLNLNFLQ